MKRNLLMLTAAVTAFAAGAASLQAQTASPTPALFGITFFGNELLNVDQATGNAASIGALGQTVNGYGVAVRGTSLYTFNPNKNVIQELGRISGKVLRDIPIGVTGLQGEGDLAFNPTTGTGYLASVFNATGQPTNDFYTFDVTTGTSARLGTTGVAINAMKFDPSASVPTLYAIGEGDVSTAAPFGAATLYTINIANGATSKVADLSVTPGSPIGAMAFTPSGVLYASIDDRLYTVDKTNGTATPVSASVLDFSFSSVSGLVFAPGAGTVGNMAARVAVGVNDNVGIGGFIIRGTPAKTVVLRGVGPSLNTLTGTLVDPLIELFDSTGKSIAMNNDFGDNNATDAAKIASFGLTPKNSKESALIRTLDAGAYTVKLRGADGGSGLGLVEIYDVDLGNGSRLANISSRGLVTSGNSILIGGLIVSGSGSQRVVVRAVGPDLKVPNPLQNPSLDIRDANGASVGTNDDFGTGGQTVELATNGLTPGDPRDSALIRDLKPGAYTALVTGVNSTGLALVEFYNLTNDTQ